MITGLHNYAPTELIEFLTVLNTLPVTVAKARSSHSASITVPLALIDPLKQTAQDFGLTFSTGRFYHAANKCQIIVKAAD